MPAPEFYTEDTLAMYMDSVLAGVAEVLGWSVSAGSYVEPVNESLLVYGVDDIGLISGRDNIKKIRAIARREVWRQVVNATAADYDFDADGGRYSRSLIHKMAMENLSRAEAEAAEYDPLWRVGVDAVTYKHDPYIYLSEDERPE